MNGLPTHAHQAIYICTIYCYHIYTSCLDCKQSFNKKKKKSWNKINLNVRPVKYTYAINTLILITFTQINKTAGFVFNYK